MTSFDLALLSRRKGQSANSARPILPRSLCPVSLEFLKLFLAIELAGSGDGDKTHEAALLFPRKRGSRNFDDHAQVVSHQRPVPNGGF